MFVKSIIKLYSELIAQEYYFALLAVRTDDPFIERFLLFLVHY